MLLGLSPHTFSSQMQKGWGVLSPCHAMFLRATPRRCRSVGQGNPPCSERLGSRQGMGQQTKRRITNVAALWCQLGARPEAFQHNSSPPGSHNSRPCRKISAPRRVIDYMCHRCPSFSSTSVQKETPNPNSEPDTLTRSDNTRPEVSSVITLDS